MKFDAKIVPFEAAPARFRALRAEGKKLVQSHGIFDLLHAGHIQHLSEAKALGDVLVVTVTADQHVNKGPGRPFFPQQLRAQSLAALACVDYVVIVPHPGAVEAIHCVGPHVYCKGRNYERTDKTNLGNLEEESRAVKKHRGQLKFVGSIVLSSTRMLNQYFGHLGTSVKEFCLALSKDYSTQAFREAVEDLARLKILVIGETIFDRYSYLRVQGLTSKNRIISGRHLREETQTGGALAVFRHVRQFTENVKFLSLVGAEPWVQAALRPHVEPRQDLILRDPNLTTIVKQRFVEPPHEGKEMNKLFAVNFIGGEAPPKRVIDRLHARVAKAVKKVDAVLLLDFGHGMMQDAVRDQIQAEAPFLALNCQTNSNNFGYNIISRRYRRADAVSLDEQELMLACGRRQLDYQEELQKLCHRLHSRYAWLTRGPVQTIGLQDKAEPCLCPPLEVEVVDTIGAGDAFFSVAALAAAAGLPVNLATFLGQLAGAQAVKIVGNAHPISKPKLLAAGMSLLNF